VKEKSEEDFNDDESRIPFQPENYYLEKSVMSLQFDLEAQELPQKSD